MSDAWNYDMASAPRGETVKVSRAVGKNMAEYEMHKPTIIIAAGTGGEFVTITQWLPKVGRWEFFSKNHPPICWQPFPTHPEAAP
jgi:hypothetical protein